MRKAVFYVQTMKWDNLYSCYYGECLFSTNKYDEAEAFCVNYQGEEQSIFIQKAFEYEKENTQIIP